MNRRQLQAIIDNPPPKSPYFKLPSVLNIVFEAEDVLKPKILLRRAPNTVTSTWGMARKMTEATKTSFLANLLQFCSIDFDAMAKGNSIASGKQIKQRLNAIVLKEGYKVEGNRVVAAERDAITEEGVVENSGEPDSTVKRSNISISDDPTVDILFGPTNPKAKRAGTAVATKQRKKRKVSDDDTPAEDLEKKQKKVAKKKKVAAEVQAS